ncbi:hypothetical protein KJ570_01280 [Patescibacteria group bacterium]|nr:hypothetical protein [Patescibacteria group bacterium]MBU2036488.1 hypothetical protein [Patescibacteria group bacterium]
MVLPLFSSRNIIEQSLLTASDTSFVVDSSEFESSNQGLPAKTLVKSLAV